MDKTKMVFMQNAPTFVIIVGIGFLIFLLPCAVAICLEDLRFGLFLISIICAGLATILSAIQQAEKMTGRSLHWMITENKKYWAKVND